MPCVSNSTRPLRTLVLLACLSGVVGLSIAGCSGGGNSATFSPAAQAKVNEKFKKRFSNFDENKIERKASR
jgi:hypothetical protein